MNNYTIDTIDTIVDTITFFTFLSIIAVCTTCVGIHKISKNQLAKQITSISNVSYEDSNAKEKLVAELIRKYNPANINQIKEVKNINK